MPSIIADKYLKTAILFATGVYLLILILSGHLDQYINMRFAWLVYLAMLLLIGLAVWQFFYLRHREETPLMLSHVVILALPVLFAIFLPAKPENTDLVSGYISIAPVAEISSIVHAYVPPADRNVPDWLRAFDEVDNPAELEGLPVDIVAFVYREPGMPENQFMAARLTSGGFGATGQAVGMPVEFETASDWEDGTWVDIQGVLRVGDFRGEPTPIIIPESIIETEAPADHINNHDHDHNH